MKITKNGRDMDILEYHGICRICGCEFIASLHDARVVHNYASGAISHVSFNCPNCNRNADVQEDDKIKVSSSDRPFV